MASWRLGPVLSRGVCSARSGEGSRGSPVSCDPVRRSRFAAARLRFLLTSWPRVSTLLAVVVLPRGKTCLSLRIKVFCLRPRMARVTCQHCWFV